MDSCGICRFKVNMAPDDGSVSLQCHKAPPTLTNMMTPKGPITIGQWPPTRPENWCGEFQQEKERLS